MVVPNSKSRKIWSLVLRLGLSSTCLILVFRYIDIGQAGKLMLGARAETLLAVAVLHLMIVASSAARWHLGLRGLGFAPPLARTTGLTFFCILLNLILPLSVGGDLARISLGTRLGVPLQSAASSGLLDRLYGLFGLGLISLFSIGFINTGEIDGALKAAMFALPPFSAVVLLSIAMLGRINPAKNRISSFVASIGADFSIIQRQKRIGLALTALSMSGHLLAIAVAIVLTNSLGYPLSIAQGLLLFPPVLFATLLPISIGGWGVREGATISLLASVGIPGEAAFATSLLFGLTQLAVVSCGTAIYFGFMGTDHRQRVE